MSRREVPAVLLHTGGQSWGWLSVQHKESVVQLNQTRFRGRYRSCASSAEVCKRSLSKTYWQHYCTTSQQHSIDSNSLVASQEMKQPLCVTDVVRAEKAILWRRQFRARVLHGRVNRAQSSRWMPRGWWQSLPRCRKEQALLSKEGCSINQGQRV